MDQYDMGTLVGKTMMSVERTSKHGNDGIEFIDAEGDVWVVMHAQDCCESVDIDDIEGELQDLVGVPLTMSECVTQDGKHADAPTSPCGECDSSTWSFCKFATVNGYVTVRFFGESNGYYGETADLYGPEA